MYSSNDDIRTQCAVKHVPIDFDGPHGNEVIRIFAGIIIWCSRQQQQHHHAQYCILLLLGVPPRRSPGGTHSSPTDRVGFNRPIPVHARTHTHTHYTTLTLLSLTLTL